MYIGMRYLVAAPIETYTEGSAITYGSGFVVGPAFAANLNYDIADNPDYGDDVELANDNGCNGYNGTVESNDIEDAIKADLLGWKAIGTTDIEYAATDEMPPEMGWGFMRVRVKPHQKQPVYEAKWFHRAQFSEQNLTGSTKKKQIEWNHPVLNVNGLGAYLDSSGAVHWFRHKTFATYAAAKAWLDGKANISSTPATST